MAETQKAKSHAMAASSSRPLQLRMRPDLSAQLQSYQGRDYWVLKDPISLKYFRFEEEEYALLKMLDGSRSPDQIKRSFDYRFAPQKITMQELYQFVGMLYRSCLLVSQASDQGIELKQRGEKNKNQQFRASLTNILAVRFKGFDPGRILSFLDPWTRWFFTWPAFICVLLMGMASIGLLFTHFELFQNKLPSFQEFFAAKNWIWLALVMAGTKVLHEFGHGLACKRFGGECHEMGVMFLVLTPCLYCNVSDSWTLPNKWKRAFIAAAGMYVELVLASIAVFVWWFSQPGLINQLALNVIFVSSVSTILFNGNPLLRYDGYYILSDLLEIPNLRQKASTVLQRTAGDWFLGIEAKPDPFLPTRRKWAFVLYSVAAALYRWLITFSIFWFVYGLLEPYGLKLIGQGIACMALYGLLGMPLVKLYKFFSVPGRLGTVKPLRAAVSAAAVALVCGAFLLIPIPHHVYCCFYVQPQNATNVYVDIPGDLVGIHAQPNEMLNSGDPIISLESWELVDQIMTMENQEEVARLKVLTVNQTAAHVVDAADQISTAQADYRNATARLMKRREEIPKLTICAPVGGVFIAPQKVEAEDSETGKLGFWTGYPTDYKNLGAYLDQKTLVGQIVPDLTKMEAVLAIDQEEIEFVRKGQSVEMVIRQLPLSPFKSKTETVSPTRMLSVPKSLSSRFGGDLVTTTNKEGQDVPQSSTYLVSVPLENVDSEIVVGGSGVAKIRTGTQTIGQRVWRLFIRTFRFDL